MLKSDNSSTPIVLFDGVCNYCNRMVNFAIKWNKRRNLRFAPLQSEAGIALRNRYGIPPTVDSIILIDGGKAYVYSSAVLRICRYLSFPVQWLYMLMAIPKFLREPVYRWVARNRYKWFGRQESCMVPTKEVKSLFLD